MQLGVVMIGKQMLLGKLLLKGLTQQGGALFAPYPSIHSAWGVNVMAGAPAVILAT